MSITRLRSDQYALIAVPLEVGRFEEIGFPQHCKRTADSRKNSPCTLDNILHIRIAIKLTVPSRASRYACEIMNSTQNRAFTCQPGWLVPPVECTRIQIHLWHAADSPSKPRSLSDGHGRPRRKVSLHQLTFWHALPTRTFWDKSKFFQKLHDSTSTIYSHKNGKPVPNSTVAAR